MRKIGFLGLGVMGLHMALNVDRKMDVEVVGFDVSEEQLRKYQAAGGTAAASVAPDTAPGTKQEREVDISPLPP